MGRSKKAAAALLNTWKFQKGDTVMIARGRNSGRVAKISGVVRDGNTSPRNGRQVPRHKKERWRENPKVYLDGKANAGRRILKGNRSVDTDRPLPMSNVCHVVQRTTATNKSSYKCVRVEFTEPEGNNRKVRVPKANPAQQLAPHWQKKTRLPKERKFPSAKFVSADVAHQRTYFPPAHHNRPAFGKPHAVSQPRAMCHTSSAAHFSSFASQVQRSKFSTSSCTVNTPPLQILHRGYCRAVWDELHDLLQHSPCSVQCSETV